MGLIIAGVVLLLLAWLVVEVVHAPYAGTAAKVLGVVGVILIVIGAVMLIAGALGGTEVDAVFAGPLAWLALRKQLV